MFHDGGSDAFAEHAAGGFDSGAALFDLGGAFRVAFLGCLPVAFASTGHTWFSWFSVSPC
jgi:hypothetical protein